MIDSTLQIWIESTGWMLIHSVWQGALATAVVAFLMAWLPRSKSNLRYTVSLGGLLAIAAAGSVTFALEAGQYFEKASNTTTIVNAASPSAAANAGESPFAELPSTQDRKTAPRNQFSTTVVGSLRDLWRRILGWQALRSLLPGIVALWVVGVSVLSARLLLQWRAIRLLNSSRQPIESPSLIAFLRRIESRLGIGHRVGLFSSTSATVPFVLGWLKPAILLPAGLLTELNAAQLEAIIAHELAHIRRHDYLLNLLQTLVETIFFYHPGVWWISRLVRQQREFCCDELAARASGDQVIYAQALLALEHWCAAPARLQVAANGGSLVQRIRRIAGVDTPRQYRPAATILAIIALLASAVALPAVNGCAKPVAQSPKVAVATVKPQDVTLTQRYVGQIKSHHHVNIRALEGGYIEEIPAKAGQLVKTGDVLVQIMPAIYKAELASVESDAMQAQIMFDQTKKMFDKNVCPKEELQVAEAKLSKAKAQVDLARARFDFTKIKAPFNGMVDRFRYQQGSLIQEGEILTTLSDNSVMWVYFNVPEKIYLDATQNQQNEKLRIELQLANGQKFDQPGELGAIEADFNHETGTIPFRADFPNPDGLLRNGQFGTVLVSQVLSDVVAIPQQAKFEILDKNYVYVVGADDVAHKREIVIQHETEDFYVVKSGLAIGDKIVVKGIRQIHEGERVEY